MPDLLKSHLKPTDKMSRKIGAKYPTLNSFVVAIFIYVCIIISLFYKIYTAEDPKKYTNQQDAFMDVFVVQTEVADTITAPKKAEEKIEAKLTEEKEQEEVTKTTNKQNPKPVEEPKPTPVLDPKPAPSVNLNELFSDVKVEQPTPKPKEQAVQSNKKSDKKTSSSSKSATDILNALQKDITAKAPPAGMTGEYNKFMGDITEIIQRKWVSYKADTNNDAKVQIFIDKFGKFSYNIISLSYNKEFNSKVKEFLERLKETQFPTPPTNTTTSVALTLRDQIDTEIQ